MASAQEIASWVVAGFDSSDTCTIERIVERVLVNHGVAPFDASEEAERKAGAVLDALHRIRLEELPFDFSTRDSRRLVGKRRRLSNDTPETRQLQARLELVEQMIKAVQQLGNQNFERISAGLMHLSGAKEAFAQCASDDGGIDIYGRLPIRLNDPKIRNGLLRSTILERSVLFLGQCKCQVGEVGPGEINAFRGASDDCLRKYEGNDRPPTHRVPLSYYRHQEMCIRVFFTTADYTEKAKTKSDSLDITLVGGRQIAEFLVYHEIGLTRVQDSLAYRVDPPSLLAWVQALNSNPHGS